MYDVTVTLYGLPEEDYPWTSALEDPSIVPPYDRRPSVVLAAATSEPLGRIIDRAGSHFGISLHRSDSGIRQSQSLSEALRYIAFLPTR